MKLPFLGVEIKMENVEVVDYKFHATENVTKKLYFQDSDGLLRDCNLRCGKDVCDGSCAKDVTMADFENGTLQVLYIC